MAGKKGVQAPGSADSDDGFEEDTWQLNLRNAISREVGLTYDQIKKVMCIVMEAFKRRVAHQAQMVAKTQVYENQDNQKSLQSIIVHWADQLVEKKPGGMNLNSADKMTRAIHSLTGGAVDILDAYFPSRWESPTPSAHVFVKFGSRTQNATLFKTLARREAAEQKLKEILSRDAFPKRYVHAVKDLAHRGSKLRTQGKIGSFRVHLARFLASAASRQLGTLSLLSCSPWWPAGWILRWKLFLFT